MSKYIDREDLMQYPIRATHCDKKHANPYFISGIESVMEYAEHLPVADVVPVVHGRWERFGYKFRYICSCCGWDVPEYEKFYAYCPNCGAKMDKEDEND